MTSTTYPHPLSPDHWDGSSDWIAKRITFLLDLRSDKNEMFFGGDAMSVDEAIENSHHSFQAELMLLFHKYPREYMNGFDVHFDGMKGDNG